MKLLIPSACLGCCIVVSLNVLAQKQSAGDSSMPYIAPASGEGELAIKRFKAPPGFKVDLWAAEPMLANPVTFGFDEKGKAYVCETFRLAAGVDDIRGIMSWLDEELASRTADEREAEMKRHLGDGFAKYTDRSERIRLLEDRAGSGKADHSTVFADKFNTPLDGIGAGILARKGKVWYANIPNLWLLQDTNADGVADTRQSLHYGFGVRVGFLGHDLHGPRFGPDGKLYFSIGDRGSNIKVADGRYVGNPDTGCVFRCDPDGANLEVFAYGLRNPQDLVFDQYGNLFTADNNSDSGDQARWVYVVEGGDSGWRVGFQFMEKPYSRGPFNAEKLWYPQFAGQAANVVPPVANVATGPSGVAYNPGTGLPASYNEYFFLVDFRGGPVNSGVHTFTLKPKGAGYELVDPEHFLWGILATDVKFGVEGGLYVSDWVEGWGLTGKGRIYHVHAPELDGDAKIVETKRLLAQDFSQSSIEDLRKLLAYSDLRVRQEAQFALAALGGEAIPTLVESMRHEPSELARLHAMWGMGQIVETHKAAPSQIASGLDAMSGLLSDPNPEVRAQAARVLGNCRYPNSFESLVRALQDGNPRVRFFAALGLAKLGRVDAAPAILALLKENDDHDPYLRHAGVMALAWIGDLPTLLSAAQDGSSAVRMGALLALRRLQRPEIAIFLKDPVPAVVLEAARAINDEPIQGAMPELATLLNTPELTRFPGIEPSHTPEPPNAPPSTRADPRGIEAFQRRVLNANFHVGTIKTAGALAAFAARSDAAAAMRVEALEELGAWAHPSGRDRVVGLWRPEAATRQAETAVQVLAPKLSSILPSAPNEVRIALLRAVGQLKMTEAATNIQELVANTNVNGNVRAEALDAASALGLPSLESLLDNARNDPSEQVRKTATRLEAKQRNPNSVARLAAALETGTVSEQQTALAALASVPGQQADELVSDWLDKLRDGKAPKELQLDVLECASKRSSFRIERKLERYESSRPSDDPLASYRECLFGGNAAEGKKIFFEKAEAQCVRCHRIDGEGGDVGPDLSHVGAQKDRRYLLESVVLPNRQIAQGFESVTLTLKNGDSYAGVLKSETPDEISIHPVDSGLLTIKKSEVENRHASISPMPEGMGQILSKEDLRNLVEFLSNQK
jgi:quinoprotein glucose dehydrogenase